MPTLIDIVSTPDRLLGIKAVWAPTLYHIASFGGSITDGPEQQRAKLVGLRTRAIRAYEKNTPFVITIGGGEEVHPEVNGRVVEVYELGHTIGPAKLFCTDPILDRWPYAITL